GGVYFGFRGGGGMRAFAVGGGGAGVVLVFGHFAAVGVDRRVDRRARGGDRARGLGFDRGGEVDFFERLERFVRAFGFAAGVGGDDPEVVGGVGGEGAQRREIGRASCRGRGWGGGGAAVFEGGEGEGSETELRVE